MKDHFQIMLLGFIAGLLTTIVSKLNTIINLLQH